jgi:heme/copper-type cytochrome/quinol oxidase subunit 4
MFNIVVGIIWQVSLVALPMYIVIQKFRSAEITAAIVVVTSIVLKFTWYDHLKAREAFGQAYAEREAAQRMATA